MFSLIGKIIMAGFTALGMLQVWNWIQKMRADPTIAHNSEPLIEVRGTDGHVIYGRRDQ